ncbi:hypothetical protein ACFPZ0_12590 [Streptomonospora nanhaiensis]|uniref:Uncharacterized protein n=1 Tax=Streptomonospora nanhaiensis TaxID=1323731 RepID=A0A853BQJ3_9ACTN|nr:hypothetical protein [Streptomonospora nanhaiensis]MBV2363921.1 hypothetical protein [Streptomonospora nanhaiensis]MBX9388740.1 hypothetical protein [Streptomonospora nanhaiensis]NYI96771.1 hypothetical protein [Streptomonospora nanhaiensis]
MSDPLPRPRGYWDSEPGSGLGRTGGGPGSAGTGSAPLGPPVGGGPLLGAPPAAYGRAGHGPGRGLPPPTPRTPEYTGPPARVGAAVAGLLCSLATLAFPMLFVLLGFPLLVLLVNVPGIAYGILALTRTSEPMEVERCIRYMWGCTFVYIALMCVILAAAVMVILALL